MSEFLLCSSFRVKGQPLGTISIQIKPVAILILNKSVSYLAPSLQLLSQIRVWGNRLKSNFFLSFDFRADPWGPTLERGSYIIGCRIYSSLEVGDIIIFRHDGNLLVKRIAAVGGDTVEKNDVSMMVSEGCYYVLGDNADNSCDSRYWEIAIKNSCRISDLG